MLDEIMMASFKAYIYTNHINKFGDHSEEELLTITSSGEFLDAEIPIVYERLDRGNVQYSFKR